MAKTEKLLEKILALLERPDNAELKPVLAATIREALHGDLERAQRESAFHKRLNKDMLNGLHSIYKEITQVATDSSGAAPAGAPASAAEATAIFHEASRQLEEIMQTTLEAADSIMNNAEALQESQASLVALVDAIQAGELDPKALGQLAELTREDMQSVNAIVEALSFQDLTGQRIKKVVKALGAIHQIVVETYVSAGLMLKKGDEAAEKDFETIARESKRQALDVAAGSELKGPSVDASQKDVDDLLAQLGL